MTKEELEIADELFLTNSVFGIWPIKKLGGTTFNHIGKITTQLQTKVNEKLTIE